MKLLDKIKNAIFEEEEFDEEFVNNTGIISTSDEEKKDIVKKIDVEKTLVKSEEKTEEKIVDNSFDKTIVRKRTTPIIFEEQDFEYEKPKQKPPVERKKEEIKKSLYGGYKEDKTKEKFKPSPIISPVYGFVGVSPVLEHKRKDSSGEKHIFTPEEPKVKSLDEIRQKAFGDTNIKEESKEEKTLLYDMEEETAPSIGKVTLGDAEEYFEDLGLEYNIDYKDDSKEKETKSPTRSTKNKKLTETVEQEIEKEKILESTQELEITKEQLKPKTADEIRKVKKIEDVDLKTATLDDGEAEEKNLYDLIDMMYDSK